MVQLFGRITDNATAKTLESGKSVINFTIALNDDYKDKEGKKVQQVTYIRCAYWVKNTTVANYLTKGKQVEVFGRLFPSVYTNTKGETVGNINANVNQLKFHSGGTTTAEPANNSKPTAAIAAGTEDDLPF